MNFTFREREIIRKALKMALIDLRTADDKTQARVSAEIAEIQRKLDES